MAGRKGPAPGKPPSAQPPAFVRFIPLALLFLLIAIVGAVTAVFFLGPGAGVFHYSDGKPSYDFCHPGSSLPCAVGNCTGRYVCLADGTWGDCTWARACVPGSRIPCLDNGCAYAYRECDPCGSGYGECVLPARSG